MPFALAAIIVALLALLPLPATAQEAPPFETTTRLDALERATGGEGPRTCYSRQEARAYEAMRVHTELMVAGLTCAEVYGMGDTYALYQNFTEAHSEFLAASQRTIEMRDGDRGYDAYRTVIANEETRLLSRWGATLYCFSRRSRFTSLIYAAPQSFRDYVEELAGRLLISQRGC